MYKHICYFSLVCHACCRYLAEISCGVVSVSCRATIINAPSSSLLNLPFPF